jgi:Chromo (CHRromatin Organisation MOdifier) domain
LELFQQDEDPYGRHRPWHPDSVEVEGDPPESRSYEVEQIVDSRKRRYGRKLVNEYLVRWRGYGPKFDEWKTLTHPKNCMELVEEYDQEHEPGQ